jgi:nucleoid-associated protein YgaU
MNTYDLESMTVLVIGTVAWMAYGWLVLAVLVTVLEQIPGAVGALAGVVAARITSTTARTLLRSSLGVAAVTPLTVGVAHATPGDSGSGSWAQVEPRSTVQLTDTAPWGAVEPQSAVRLTEHAASSTPAQSAHRTDVPATPEPAAGVRLGVPDRPAVGAATRYTDVRSGVAVRMPARVVVHPGDSLWSLAAHELGPDASAAEIAARWPEWYAANRQVIGSDPDLILPGQVLRIPAAATGHVPPTHQEK